MVISAFVSQCNTSPRYVKPLGENVLLIILNGLPRVFGRMHRHRNMAVTDSEVSKICILGGLGDKITEKWKKVVSRKFFVPHMYLGPSITVNSRDFHQRLWR